jgi:hypothetical protein
MLVSQKLAIAAHLHVLLRRKTGRVTDTEWLAANLEYALEIIRFSRAKALEDGHADLAEWADKLERAMLEPGPGQRTSLVQTAAQLLRDRAPGGSMAPPSPSTAPDSNSIGGFAASTFGDIGFADSLLEPGKSAKPRDPNAPRYVGGIR